MSLRVAKMQKHELSFPRVSGDEPYAWSDSLSVGRFSPRERG